MYAAAVDLKCCRASVHSGGRDVAFYQCSRKGRYEGELEGGKYLFCKQHHPDTVEEKKAAQQAAWDKKDSERDVQEDIQQLEAEIIKTCIWGREHMKLPGFISKKVAKLVRLREKTQEQEK